MGGALVEGWTRTGAFQPADLILCDPNPGPAALAAEAAGARLNPPDAVLRQAATVLLSVKPQIWRQAAEAVAPLLEPGAVVVSIAAGVTTKDLSQAFEGRPVARVMPTTAVALAKGVASVFADEPLARERAHALFAPVATVVDLDSEAMVDAATGVSGSGPAYFYAFIEALEAAAQGQGFEAEAAARMVRGTLVGAAALLDQSAEEPAELRRQVTSPGGTTEAALKILMGEKGLWPLVDEAVKAAVERARELGR
ncbi:pyrroline-5-carboxylate reductase [Phenylobacterium montanum]|nr:pyrroline-5-carboxylate reductase [Caulobacter sp. S6]